MDLVDQKEPFFQDVPHLKQRIRAETPRKLTSITYVTCYEHLKTYSVFCRRVNHASLQSIGPWILFLS